MVLCRVQKVVDGCMYVELEMCLEEVEKLNIVLVLADIACFDIPYITLLCMTRDTIKYRVSD
jgi:hypothetical protein